VTQVTESCTEWIDGDGTASLEQAARYELACLWSDLQERLTDCGGVWSGPCPELAARIRRLTAHLGPCPWGDVPTLLLQSGYYERLHAEWGVPAPVDWSRVPYRDGAGAWQWPDSAPLTAPE